MKSNLFLLFLSTLISLISASCIIVSATHQGSTGILDGWIWEDGELVCRTGQVPNTIGSTQWYCAVGRAAWLDADLSEMVYVNGWDRHFSLTSTDADSGPFAKSTMLKAKYQC
jgi:hypothetical protein